MKKWSIEAKFTFATIVIAILTLVAMFLVPEIREWLGLETTTPSPGTADTTITSHTVLPSTVPPTNTPSRTPTSIPTVPDTPSPTPEPMPTATPVPPCMLEGLFSGLWWEYHDQLGCPLEDQPRAIVDCEQPFENGHMFWRKDNDWAYAVYESGPKAGVYEQYTGWDERPYTCPYEPPDSRVKPERGFGWVWCTQLHDPVTTLGWGLEPEMGYRPGHGDPLVQEFERGFIFRDSDGTAAHMAYVFFDAGTFTRQGY